MRDSCKHYWQPKYDPNDVPSMMVCRCIKCGKEEWTAFDQIEEWRKNGLNGKQVQEEGRPADGH